MYKLYVSVCTHVHVHMYAQCIIMYTLYIYFGNDVCVHVTSQMYMYIRDVKPAPRSGVLHVHKQPHINLHSATWHSTKVSQVRELRRSHVPDIAYQHLALYGTVQHVHVRLP